MDEGFKDLLYSHTHTHTEDTGVGVCQRFVLLSFHALIL